MAAPFSEGTESVVHQPSSHSQPSGQSSSDSQSVGETWIDQFEHFINIRDMKKILIKVPIVSKLEELCSRVNLRIILNIGAELT